MNKRERRAKVAELVGLVRDYAKNEGIIVYDDPDEDDGLTEEDVEKAAQMGRTSFRKAFAQQQEKTNMSDLAKRTQAAAEAAALGVVQKEAAQKARIAFTKCVDAVRKDNPKLNGQQAMAKARKDNPAEFQAYDTATRVSAN